MPELIGILRCRNEEENIVSFLNNVVQVEDHVCLVDAESTDRTRFLVNGWSESHPGFVWWEDYLDGSISNEVYFSHEARQINQGLERIRKENGTKDAFIIMSGADEIFCPRVTKHLRSMLGEEVAYGFWGIHLIGDPDHFAHSLKESGQSLLGGFSTRVARLSPELKCFGAVHATFSDQYPSPAQIRGAIFHYGYMDREKEWEKVVLRAKALGDMDATYQHLFSNGLNKYVTEEVPWELCHAECQTCWIEELHKRGQK